MTKKQELNLNELSFSEKKQVFNKLQKLEQAKKFKKQEFYLENAHEGQLEFHKSQKRIRLFFGGNRTGKSTAGVNEDVWLAKGNHPHIKRATPLKVIVIANDFQNHVNNVLWPKFEEWSSPTDIKRVEKNQTGVPYKLFFKNGSTVTFRSHDQDIKTFESEEFDVAHFDEPPPKKIWDAVMRGLVDRGGIAYITATPINCEPWLYEIYERSRKGEEQDIWSRFSSMYDNATNLGDGDKELGMKRIKQFEADLDEDTRISRIEGKFMHLQGRVFKGWDRSHHVIAPFEWPSEWPVILSFDPHPRKPWAQSVIGMTPDGSKILLSSELVEGVTWQQAEHMNQRLKDIPVKHGKSLRVMDARIDNASNVSSMVKEETSILEDLNKHITQFYGIPQIKAAPKGRGSVDDKIEIFKKWLSIKTNNFGKKRAEFYVFDVPETQRFVFEIEHFVYDKYRGVTRSGYKDKPRKVDDDCIDSVLQIALMNPTLDRHAAPINMLKSQGSYNQQRTLKYG